MYELRTVVGISHSFKSAHTEVGVVVRDAALECLLDGRIAFGILRRRRTVRARGNEEIVPLQNQISWRALESGRTVVTGGSCIRTGRTAGSGQLPR